MYRVTGKRGGQNGERVVSNAPRGNYTLISDASHGTVTLLVRLNQSIASFEPLKSRAFVRGYDGTSAMIKREIIKKLRIDIKELRIKLIYFACNRVLDIC